MKQFFLVLSISLSNQVSISQNVGVGTTTPLEKLHVNGNIKVDSVKANALRLPLNAGDGKVLTSDATGNGTWQTQTTGSTSGGAGFGSWGDCSMNGVSEYNPVADPDGAGGDNGGYSVAISGNFAIVGADGDDCCGDQNRGSASFYHHDGSKWVFMQKITDADGGADDHFGISVAISGNYAIVGAYGDDCCGGSNQGSVSTYQFDGTNWVSMYKMTDPDGNNGDAFGCSVSISGNYALIGAFGDDGPLGVDQGSACIYQLNGSVWVFKQKLTDANGSAVDYFGTSVSISGNLVIIGAYADDNGPPAPDAGSACIFQFNGATWVFKQKLPGFATSGQSGYSVSISGNYAAMGAPGENRCYIYRYNGLTWESSFTLLGPTPSSIDFGWSVTLSGDYIIVGDHNYEIDPSNVPGAAYVYVRLGRPWQKIQLIKDPVGVHGDHFGYSTAIDGESRRFLIGTYGYYSSSGKAIFGKIN